MKDGTRDSLLADRSSVIAVHSAAPARLASPSLALARLAPGQDRQGRRSYCPRVALGPALSLAALLLCSSCGQEPQAPAGPSAPATGQAATHGAPGAPAFGTAGGVRPMPRSTAPAFDASWAAHVSNEALFYASVKGLDFYNPTLFGKPEDTVKMRQMRSRLAGGSSAASFGDWLQEINDWLLDHKLAQASFLEVLGAGFAFATERREPEPVLLLVAPWNQKLRDFVAGFEKDLVPSTEIFRKDVAAGQLVTVRKPGRQSPFCYHTGAALFCASNDPVRLEAALERAAGKGPSFATTARYQQAVARLDPEAVVSMVADPHQAAQGLKPTTAAGPAPLPPPTGANPAALASSLLDRFQPGARGSELLSKLTGLSAQFVYTENLSHLDVFAELDPKAELPWFLSAALPENAPRAQSLVSANHPFFLSTVLARSPAATAEPAALQGAPESPLQTRQALAAMLGLNYEADVEPWLGQEFAVTALWDAKLPQVALMAAVGDPSACERTMSRVTSLYKGRLTFTEKTVSGARTRVTSLPGHPDLAPCYTVHDGFLIVATGLQVVESLVDSPQKLRDQPGFASLFTIMGGDKLQYAGYLSTQLLERVAEATSPNLAALAEQIRVACAKNLAELAAKKLPAAQALCPGGGTYSEAGGQPEPQARAVGPASVPVLTRRQPGQPECSIHGSLVKPKPLPATAINPQVVAARELQNAVATVALGAGMTEPGTYRLSFVFRKR